MTKLFIGVTSLALISLVANVANAGPASKFTATVDKTAVCSTTMANGDCADVGAQVNLVMATIKIPGNSKELLMGFSSQIAIDTETKVKGKNGGGGTATATGNVAVSLSLENLATGEIIVAEPGEITFAARTQELEAVLGGVIESCTVPFEGPIIIEDDCVVSDELIRLLLETTAAYHYNFLASNVPVGEYQVTARVSVDTEESTVDTDPEAGSEEEARATVVVGPSVLAIQVVKATNNPDGVLIIDGNE